MSTSNVVVVRGRSFELVMPEDPETNACEGCAAHTNNAGNLCGALPKCGRGIFVEVLEEAEA